jgi:hypothetical protein
MGDIQTLFKVNQRVENKGKCFDSDERKMQRMINKRRKLEDGNKGPNNRED